VHEIAGELAFLDLAADVLMVFRREIDLIHKS
jgi:hypothetical protein